MTRARVSDCGVFCIYCPEKRLHICFIFFLFIRDLVVVRLLEEKQNKIRLTFKLVVFGEIVSLSNCLVVLRWS